MNQNCNFLRDGRVQTKTLTVEGYGYFLKYIFLEDYATQKIQAKTLLQTTVTRTPSTKFRSTVLLHRQQIWWLFLQLFEGFKEIIKGCLTFTTSLGAEKKGNSQVTLY